MQKSFGAVAQLGERLNGIQEVEGSTPFSSTFCSTEFTNQCTIFGKVHILLRGDHSLVILNRFISIPVLALLPEGPAATYISQKQSTILAKEQL